MRDLFLFYLLTILWQAFLRLSSRSDPFRNFKIPLLTAERAADRLQGDLPSLARFCFTCSTTSERLTPPRESKRTRFLNLFRYSLSEDNFTKRRGSLSAPGLLPRVPFSFKLPTAGFLWKQNIWQVQAAQREHNWRTAGALCNSVTTQPTETLWNNFSSEECFCRSLKSYPLLRGSNDV